MTDSFRQMGAVRVGDSVKRTRRDADFVLASILVEPEQIILTFATSRHIFPREHITRLSHWQGILASGLRIEHSVSQHRSFLIFWTLNYRKLKRVLEEMGYSVIDNKENIRE